MRGRDFSKNDEQYDAFKQMDFEQDDMVRWLGDKQCILMIDELNNMLRSQALAIFLKETFVSRKNRYLIFSSHVVTVTTELSHFFGHEQ